MPYQKAHNKTYRCNNCIYINYGIAELNDFQLLYKNK